MSYISKELRDFVESRAENRCEYCLISQDVRAFSFQIDHVISEKHDGPTTLNNLALSCPKCNAYKGSDIGTNDPQTGELVRLFNPRTQNWNGHFRVDEDGTIVGLTPEGRATARLLQFNQADRLRQRAAYIRLGLYPRTKDT